jgi:predicted O-linked N-acetylglucosamine transferase (SPINDLY family)
MRQRIETAFDHFIDVQAMSDAEVAAMMREMEVDIAIDLNGYAAVADAGRMGILAHRPAPVQVNYLGYPGTMGVPFIDYIIADRMVIPEEHRSISARRWSICRMPTNPAIANAERQATPTRAEVGCRKQASSSPASTILTRLVQNVRHLDAAAARG